jgi:hypothetical protein
LPKTGGRTQMKRTDYYVQYIHAKTGVRYLGIFHSEKEMQNFISDFIAPRKHVLVKTWIESY